MSVQHATDLAEDAILPADAAAPAAAVADRVAVEPRWLDDDEQRTWRAFLAATQVFFARLDRELQQNDGLPHAYYEILVRLSETPGRRMRMSDLADRSLSSRSRLSHAVSRLEEAGWIVREPCADDRRGAYAVLTDTGFAVLDRAARGHVEGVRSHLLDLLDDDELVVLHRISDKMITHLAGLDGGMANALADLAATPPAPQD